MVQITDREPSEGAEVTSLTSFVRVATATGLDDVLRDPSGVGRKMMH
jgi:hypothetical protein